MPKNDKKNEDIFSDIALKPVEISADMPNDKKKDSKVGMKIARRFTKLGQTIEDIFNEVTWVKRLSLISDEKGKVISSIKDVEVPSFWSQLATDIIATKYFRKAGVPTPEGRETSVRQPIFRIVKSFANFGERFGYFSSEEDKLNYEAELTHLLLYQKAAFNSPVWFNVGLYQQYHIEGTGGSWFWDFKENKVIQSQFAYRNPQCSACFILSLEDTLPGIFDLVKTEAMIFKYGSGAGANYSTLRSRYERLSGGGLSSGLMSFLRVFDRAAGATKSGGTTRRAAKMVVINISHPEIEDFVSWKVKEEEKAQALIAAGYESDFNGDAYSTVSGQNSNNSVRITDDFMKAYENDGEWQTRSITTGEPYHTYRAKDLMDKIAYAAWRCADPGVQFDTTINNWHTCPNSGRINASNPCSEYMFVDDSACNLASINLSEFVDEKGEFNITDFRHACRIFTISQEMAVDFSSYPTEKVAKNSHDFRPLGLGYANLGTLLMLRGVPYDSPEGWSIAGAITAIMCGHAYKTSAELAGVKGSFAEFNRNRAPMLNVMKKHRDAAYKIDEGLCPAKMLESARQDWDEALALGEQFGYRNAQTTVIAPTGTIGLLMDCDTTGVEPDFALVKFKKLAGGGSMKIVNNAVQMALSNLGYTKEEQTDILTYALGTGEFVESTPINRTSLKDKGLTEDEINNIEKVLPSTFDINYAFNRSILGEDVYNRLNISLDDEMKNGYSFLKSLGFTNSEIDESNEVICGTQTVEDAPHLKKEHYPVFDCASRCGPKGTRFLPAMAHIHMMAAVQPFISGAISKTINLPNEATIEDVKDVYIQSWKLGLKALALYRDGSKLSQPLNVKQKAEGDSEETAIKEVIKEVVKEVYLPIRHRMPDERQSITHKFNIAGHKGYITAGLYEDGKPGEIFVTMSKQGSVINGLMDSFATSISIALQYGVPLSTLVRKFSHSRFEPYGFTSNPQIRVARSIVDYIFRYLGLKFLSEKEQLDIGIKADSDVSTQQTALNLDTKEEEKKEEQDLITATTEVDPSEEKQAEQKATADAPVCANCGSMMMKTGTCYTCLNCASTSGGCS